LDWVEERLHRRFDAARLAEAGRERGDLFV
jgi:hypothetical protein